MKINMNRLKNYLSDLGPDTSIVDEAIATIEAVAENKTDDELYECERPLMIAYLALRIVKAGLNISLQNDEVHAHWETPEKQFPYWDWKCSACGCEEYRQRDSHGNYRRMNFCPNCGAKMDEKTGGKM